ncbi:Hypothetical predicted protein [Xyrichtys novacula]|uniref:Uncharacterized protein n=1 Tax=Xyrichtys novacula TaxID=13765 RepID=A0AAV1FUY5_XYRNO|nr:Hypothetical predicted protein [Xyrichtys novacula]
MFFILVLIVKQYMYEIPRCVHADGHLLIHVRLRESAGSSSSSSTLEEQQEEEEEEEEDFSAVPCRAQWKYTRLLGVLSKRKGGKKTETKYSIRAFWRLPDYIGELSSGRACYSGCVFRMKHPN